MLNGRETVFLSGIRRQRLSKLARSYPTLAPQRIRNTYYWDFPQVVGFRVLKFLVSRFGHRRAYPEKAAGFVSRARGEQRSPGAITKSGKILWEDTPSVYVDDTGQTVHEALGIKDNVLAQFTVGGIVVGGPAVGDPADGGIVVGGPAVGDPADGGIAVGGTAEIQVPAMLEPSLHTSVHPSVQHGTPVVTDTRIPATVIAQVFKEGRLEGLDSTDLDTRVQEMYPEVDIAKARDAARVGDLILAAS